MCRNRSAVKNHKILGHSSVLQRQNTDDYNLLEAQEVK
jgi:hypothetical protein